MEILFARGMWGMTESSLDANLDKIRDAGFQAVEMGIPAEESGQRALRAALERTGLALIAQQWTTGRTPEEHARSFEEQYRHAVGLKPLLVNSHTGRDIFSVEQNAIVFRAAARLESELGFRVVHETHRGRALFSAPAASALLDALPGLRLTADFSHWCCVHESLLRDQEEAVQKAIEATWHIHARVGHAEGPQVTHPGAPEWKDAVEAHVDWWKRIVERQRRRGAAELTICPEFGPMPYMPTLPWTRQPVADLWEVNLYMKDLLRERLLVN
jgi:sugar phosphate isomerase/epimerase